MPHVPTGHGQKQLCQSAELIGMAFPTQIGHIEHLLGVYRELIKTVKGHCSSHIDGKLGRMTVVVGVTEVGPPESRTVTGLSSSPGYSSG